MTVKFAQTIDGRLATATGDSKWISSEASLTFAHKLRAEHDAILVGVGTVLADDPRLTVRLVKGRDPLRVVIDTNLKTPPRSKLLVNGAARRTLIATGNTRNTGRARRLETLGAEILPLPQGKENSGLDLSALLRELGRRGIESVLVEGGAGIITSFLRAKLVDRIIVVIAPKIIGCGKDSIGDLGITRLRDALKLDHVKARRLGPDLVLDATLRRRSRS